MAIEILTKDDLIEFRHQLIQDFREILEAKVEDDAKRWLKSAEVQKLLNISAGTLQNLRINGTLSYSRMGTIIFYDSIEIDKILRANNINGNLNLFSKL